MRYVIAGGGEYGSHYLNKISSGIDRGTIPPHEIIVVDRDPDCKAAVSPPHGTKVHVEVCEWRAFGRRLWSEPSDWLDDIWVPAPIAPHILAEWLIDRVRDANGTTLVPWKTEAPLPQLPFAKKHPDHRILLSHAPGLCPVDCIEPSTCAITKGFRWWEMGDTIAEWLPTENLEPSVTAMFFCKHHCAHDQHDVGGIPFSVVFRETDKVLDGLREGAQTVAVATFSSCHGVITPFRVAH